MDEIKSRGIPDLTKNEREQHVLTDNYCWECVDRLCSMLRLIIRVSGVRNAKITATVVIVARLKVLSLQGKHTPRFGEDDSHLLL